MYGCSRTSAAKPQPKPGPALPSLWPAAPVPVSPVEGVIEAFWDPGLDALNRWTTETGAFTRNWCACFLAIPVDRQGSTAQLTRDYRLNLADYRRLRVRLRPGAGVKTTVTAEVDGAEQRAIDTVADGNSVIEIVGPIAGERLTKLTLAFQVSADAAILPPEHQAAAAGPTHGVMLCWIMLEKDGEAWTPPEQPFAGMLEHGTVDGFEPGLGLVFGAEELAAMRANTASPMFEAPWARDLDAAAEQYRVDPAAMIRPCVLYAPTRYGRPWDLEVDTGNDGLLLALVGLITRNPGYMRQAARHAVALARIDEWAEGFMDRFPEGGWTHAGFAPNVATIKASLLLDWTWNWLTPAGREFVREAIRGKGLLRLQGMENRMANQGVRFTKGLVLGSLAVADDRSAAALRARIQGYIDKMNRKLETVVRPDGTFSEGMGYGKGTMASLPITCVAASRCLERPVADLVTERFLPAMRFILTAESGIAPSFAAFCAGPLGDPLFADLCVPASAMAAYGGPEWNSTGGNTCEYVFYGLIPAWAPKIQSLPEQPGLPPFSVFPEGGWVFAGSDAPEAPRLSFESGLWDGRGHSWYRKHALTLDAWGGNLLCTRQHLSYDDARSRYTMSTKLFNTFAPGGRDQDATGTPGRGARLIKADDRGAVVLVESDNATAWKQNVKRAVRRVLFIRPNVLVVQDMVELESPETGVQSWNSLHPWDIAGGLRATSRAGAAAVRLTCFGGNGVALAAGEDSVHRSPTGEVPVYRAAFTSRPARRHRLLTVIEAIPPAGAGEPASVKVLDNAQPLIEVRQGSSLVRVAGGEVAPSRMWGHKTDDEFSFAMQECTE